MKPVLIIVFVTILLGCADEDTAIVAVSTEKDFSNPTSLSEGTEITLTQSEAFELLTSRDAKLVNVVKPNSAIRRWWKAFSLRFEKDGEYEYSTIEDDVIPANGNWTFTKSYGTDIVLFNTDPNQGEEFERLATLVFKTVETDMLRFHLIISMEQSNRYADELIGEWIYIFEI